MKWAVSTKRSMAESDKGYRITWAKHPAAGKSWFNAYTPGDKQDPEGRCIEASFDHEICKAACERHLAARAESA